jgi:hypothetical protein
MSTIEKKPLKVKEYTECNYQVTMGRPSKLSGIVKEKKKVDINVSGWK